MAWTDETWNYHLRRGDYSRWFRQAVKDSEVSDEAPSTSGRIE